MSQEQKVTNKTKKNHNFFENFASNSTLTIFEHKYSS